MKEQDYNAEEKALNFPSHYGKFTPPAIAFREFCQRLKVTNMGPMTNEDGMFVRVGVIHQDEGYKGIRVYLAEDREANGNLASEDTIITTEIFANNGSDRYLPHTIIGKTRLGRSASTGEIGEQTVRQLHHALVKVENLKPEDLNREIPSYQRQK